MRIPKIVTLNEVKGLGEGRRIFIYPTTRFFVASLLRMTFSNSLRRLEEGVPAPLKRSCYFNLKG